ncbi:ABC transporter substrate-binding protein [Effusibacillus dendaii]|uniref:Branched chain amino acid ABC transporter substrate-binding protein n=1 Tax=Effusibacillus dendaii TaxID=2743772 RepID=A0A7I8D7X3_9BACL|nr:ABC transporter substrate-binding protein [Effusibacillus dendaii]BCJ85482.1 branched chain amino acid ABC transporter substrate-binding protein [Effusibacillus dendaii]
MLIFKLASASLLVCGLMLTAACGGNSQSNPTGGNAAKTSGDPIKVGAIVELTGGAALSGKFKQQGIELAVEQINKEGGIMGRPVQAVFEDDQTSNPGAVSAYQKLISQNVVAVIGSIRSTETQALDPYIRNAKIPMLFGGTDDKLTQAGNEWLLRFRPPDRFAAETLVDYTANDLQKKRIAIIYSSETFGENGKNLVAAELKKRGLEPAAVIPYTQGNKNWTPILDNIKRSDADAVLTYMNVSEDSALLLKQYRQMGLQQTYVGAPASVSNVTLNLAKEAAEGIYGVGDYVPNQNEANKKFTAAFQAKFGQIPDGFAGWVYDAMMALKKAIDQEKSTAPDKIRQGILSIKGWEGTEGVYDFDPNGDGLHGYTVVKIENGTQKIIKMVNFKK